MSYDACQKQHRQNEPAGQVDLPTRVEVHVKNNTEELVRDIPTKVDMCRDHRCLTILSKTTQTE